VALGLLICGFGWWRAVVGSGKVEHVAYESKVLPGKRRLLVYLPPGYSAENRYPVLYLLPGAGDDETAWRKNGHVDDILDDLLSREEAVPLIVVMPDTSGRGRAFEDDLFQDVIPFVESHYAVRAERESRAIAGLSMGGGQALRIGLGHPDKFAWIGGFAASLSGQEPTDLLGDSAALKRMLKLLWLSCGDEDHLLEFNRSIHALLDQQGIPHMWHIGSGEHEWKVWRDDLRRFAARLFRD
jgi:enterochelin esterase-like enzyme